jgi:hypothetical protein
MLKRRDYKLYAKEKIREFKLRVIRQTANGRQRKILPVSVNKE